MAPVVAANLRNDTLVAAVGAYQLLIPPGLEAYEDRTYVLSIPGATVPVVLTFLIPPIGLSKAATGGVQHPGAGTAWEPHDLLGRRGAVPPDGKPTLRLFSGRD